MKQGYQTVTITRNECVGPSVYCLELSGSFDCHPGQFFMLKAWRGQPYLARPLSIYNCTEDTLSFLYLVVGSGTERLSQCEVGEEIQVLGPLGEGFALAEEGQRAALVAGGVGIAPLLYLARELTARGVSCDLYAGFRSEPYATNAFEPYVQETVIATEDGSVGHKGYVTDHIPANYDVLYACGPNPMMNQLQSMQLAPTEYYSLEARMGCGFGVCVGCVVDTPNGKERVCMEGPVFESSEVYLS